jgi:tetratricopeptide (TPR) repeat protein
MREYRAGVRDFQVGQLKRSLDHFERSLRSDPQFVPAVIGRGVTRQQLGDHPYSVPDLRTASENSSDGVVMECLAYALFKTGQSQPAAATYELAIRSRPDSAQLRVNQACAAMRGGQLSAAEKTVTEAIELDPHLQAAYLLRAEVRLNRLLSGRGALEEVLHDLRCAARSGPPCWSIELYTAVAYARAAKQNADLEEVVAQHLRAAVQLGVQRTLLERQRLLDAFRDRPWLRAAIEEASPNRGAEPFNPVTSPDPRAVASLLARMAR